MNARNFVLPALMALGLACQSQRTAEPERPDARAAENVNSAARAVQEEAAEARRALNKRLDDLDGEVEKLGQRAEKASAKTRAKLDEKVRDMRAEAKALRNRMSTWDDKTESAWRSAKREVEEGLDKTGNAIKNLADDIKR